MGASLPGCPLFAVARTDRVAWGVTYMKGDTFDFFVEDVRRGGGTGWQFRRGDQWHDFVLREEELKQKGGGSERLRCYESPQGILEGDPGELGEGLQLAMLWSGNCGGATSGGSVEAWLKIIAAGSTHEAMESARACQVPTLCWVIADRDGHIGLQTCGRFPVRGGGQVGLAPIPAWDEQNHWRGWLDPRRLPSVLDPPEGYVATANEELNPPGLPMLITQPLPGYRWRRIVERLAQLPSATLAQMQDLQYDLVSVQARDLLQVFLPHIPPGPLHDRLSQWDCRYDPASREATLFHRLYIHVMVECLGTETGVGWRRMVYLCTRVGYSLMLVHTADRMLLDKGTSLWKHDDIAALVRRAAEKTAADERADLPWSEVNAFHFADRFFGGQQVGRLLGFESRRYPMPGNHATPFQGHVLQTATRESTFAPSYHFVTDLGTDEAWTNLPGGPSESRFSRWYKSDIARWFSGQYKKLSLE
jgi:penicillin amidase